MPHHRSIAYPAYAIKNSWCILNYIALTDMVKNFDGGSALIEQWLKNKDTVLLLGVWEQINNPCFNSLEFEGVKNETGRNSFYLDTKHCQLFHFRRHSVEVFHTGCGEQWNSQPA